MASSRSRPPAVRSVRTPEALDALRARLDLYAPASRQGGRDLFQQGAVAAVWSEADHHCKAEVNDNVRHTLTLFYTRGDWTSRCSCPIASDCKHAYAAGLAWIAAVEAGRPTSCATTASPTGCAPCPAPRKPPPPRFPPRSPAWPACASASTPPATG
ncbi:MAG: hypothetical protein NTU80_05520 [Verrucomicrobia bacterium]|nr:hypothetical protein [Verrucomicrobiota bacterium]